jgi:hypothetical protein
MIITDHCIRMKQILIWLGFASLSILSAQEASKPAPSDAWATKTIQVKYVDPEQLREMFSGQSYVMEADRALGVLTVHGPPAFLKEVEDTAKRFDVAPPLPANIEISVYLLATAAQASPSGALPPELAAIGKELKAAGGSVALKLADYQMIRVRAGQPAEALGPAPASPTVATLVRIRLDSASLSPDPKGDVISLNGLRVWLNVPSPGDTSQPQAKGSADVTADIDVRQNQAVIVAKAGIDKPLVVIVRAGLATGAK